MRIKLISATDVISINREICLSEKQKHLCVDKGKVESAVSAAFYPGIYPFQYGGLTRVAGALCFFLIKAPAFFDGNKRSAAMAATILLDLNGMKLIYPIDKKKKMTAFATIIEKCATSEISKEELMQWFERHKK